MLYNRLIPPPDRVQMVSPLLKIVDPLASKSCELDPVPSLSWLFSDLPCPVIWKIVNLSLETSVMPTELKQAVIRPLLKKPSLDYQEFKNFRPISNLTFLSKVIEKVVALQLVDLTWTIMVCVKFFFLICLPC